MLLNLLLLSFLFILAGNCDRHFISLKSAGRKKSNPVSLHVGWREAGRGSGRSLVSFGWRGVLFLRLTFDSVGLIANFFKFIEIGQWHRQRHHRLHILKGWRWHFSKWLVCS